MPGVARRICYTFLALTMMFLPLQVIHAEMFHECGAAEVVEDHGHNHAMVDSHLDNIHQHQQVHAERHANGAVHNTNCSYCYYQNSCCDDENNCKCHVITSLFVAAFAELELFDDLSSVCLSNYSESHIQHDSVPLLRPPII